MSSSKEKGLSVFKQVTKYYYWFLS